MTTYVLCEGVTAVQTIANVGGNQNQIVQPSGPNANVNSPPTAQGFEVVVTGTSGNVSATVQPVASEDGVNFFNYGSTIVVSSASSPAVKDGSGSVPHAFFGAFVTAISGTGAKVKTMMSA